MLSFSALLLACCLGSAWSNGAPRLDVDSEVVVNVTNNDEYIQLRCEGSQEVFWTWRSELIIDYAEIKTDEQENSDYPHVSTLTIQTNISWLSAAAAKGRHQIMADTKAIGGTEEVVVVVDLRTDGLSRPSPLMKKAMMEAALGDDIFGEDPTVNALQDKVAALLGKEAALFVPTGTMANLVAVLTHCPQRGSEVILGDLSHIHVYEQGGIAQLGGVHSRTVSNLPDGTFDLEELCGLVRAVNESFPITALVCVENTHNMAGGKVMPLEWMDELGATCQQLGLPLHMDGARLLNAAITLDQPPERLVRNCTTIALSFDKTLGAPIGSILAGPAEFIKRARRTRKAVGGGMCQPGMLAAAGIYALDNMYPTLGRDHLLVQQLAEAVKECCSSSIKCDPEGAHTNILMLECDCKKITPIQLCQRMGQVTEEEKSSLGENVIIHMLPMTANKARIVVYCDITPEQVQSAVRKIHYVIKEIDSEE